MIKGHLISTKLTDFSQGSWNNYVYVHYNMSKWFIRWVTSSIALRLRTMFWRPADSTWFSVPSVLLPFIPIQVLRDCGPLISILPSGPVQWDKAPLTTSLLNPQSFNVSPCLHLRTLQPRMQDSLTWCRGSQCNTQKYDRLVSWVFWGERVGRPQK